MYRRPSERNPQASALDHSATCPRHNYVLSAKDDRNYGYQKGLRLQTKLKVYKAVVLTNLLDGCETWTCYRRHIKALDRFHMRHLRILLKIK